MMGAAERSVGQPGTRADDGNRNVVIANVDSDLLQAAIGDERCDRVADRAQAGHCQAGGNADHVGFRHAAVVETPGTFQLELVEEAVADVAGEENNPVVFLGEPSDFVGKGVSHDTWRISAAAASSSAVGTR